MRGLFPAANSMPCNQSWQSNSLRYGADCIKMTVDFFNEKRDIWSRKEAEAMEKNNQERVRVVRQVKPIPAAIPRRERVAAYCRVSSGKDAISCSGRGFQDDLGANGAHPLFGKC